MDIPAEAAPLSRKGLTPPPRLCNECLDRDERKRTPFYQKSSQRNQTHDYFEGNVEWNVIPMTQKENRPSDVLSFCPQKIKRFYGLG